MRYRPLGQTGLEISEVGFGGLAIGGNAYGNSYGTTDDAASVAAIRAAYDAGCNFFETADLYGYGHSEELLAQALAGIHPKPVIATKIGRNFYGGSARTDLCPTYLRFAIDMSLNRLRTGRLDICQLHNPPLDVISRGEAVTALEELRQQGKIGIIGASVFTKEEALCCLTDPRIEVVQVVYSLLYREMESPVFEAARAQGTAIIAREPLAHGFLAGKRAPSDPFELGDIRCLMPPGHRAKLTGVTQRVREVLAARTAAGGPVRTLAQVALQFVLRHPAVSVVIPGIKTAEQAWENMAASDLGPLEDEFLSALLGPAFRPTVPAQLRYAEPSPVSP